MANNSDKFWLRICEIEDLFNKGLISANESFVLRLLATIEEHTYLNYENYKESVLNAKNTIQ